MSDIKEYLEQQSNIRGRMGCNLLDWFLLRNGQEFKRTAHAFPMGKMKECFKNASDFVVDASLDDGYRYCEGYGWRPGIPLLIHHAWVLDHHDRVIDTTWRDNADCLYWGVPFDLDTLVLEMIENGVYGLLDIGGFNINLMQSIDSGVEDYLEEMAASRKEWREVSEKIYSE